MVYHTTETGRMVNSMARANLLKFFPMVLKSMLDGSKMARGMAKVPVSKLMAISMRVNLKAMYSKKVLDTILMVP